MTLTAGTKLGPYEVLSPLGAGGMGEVYRARDAKLNRDVAIKVLPEAVAEDAERLARFQREAQVLASLNHPHIAAIYGLEKAGNVEALVLELVEGETLAERIAAGPMPLDEALAIARQIADALEAAHEKGIVHRDLKPANVKVTPEGKVKVLDFGLAKALFEARRMLAHKFGYPEFCALPERARIRSLSMTLRARLAQGALAGAQGGRLRRRRSRAGSPRRTTSGIVHRDLKPENVFVVEDGRVKILDFGLARQMPRRAGADETVAADGRETEPGTVMGTVGYMSPEQVRGLHADSPVGHLLVRGRSSTRCSRGSRAFQRGTRPRRRWRRSLNEGPAGASRPPGEPRPRLSTGCVRHCLEKNPARAVPVGARSSPSISKHGRRPPEACRPSRCPPAGALEAAAWPRSRRSALLASRPRLHFWCPGSELAPRAPAHAPHDIPAEDLPRPLSIFRARFAPDGRTIVYIAARATASVPESLPAAVSSTLESRCSLGLSARAHPFSRSPDGRRARGPRPESKLTATISNFVGTLARVPLARRRPARGARERPRRRIVVSVQTGRMLVRAAARVGGRGPTSNSRIGSRVCSM